jgi:hypothetical protein
VELAFLGCGGFLLVEALRNFYYGSARRTGHEQTVALSGRTYWLTAAVTERDTRRNWNTSTRIKAHHIEESAFASAKSEVGPENKLRESLRHFPRARPFPYSSIQRIPSKPS